VAATDDQPKTVAEVMQTPLVTCRPDATLRAVAALLAEHRIHAIVVEASDDHVACAVVTDRDVVHRYARGELDRIRAREAAAEPTVTVRPDSDLRQASELMAQFGTTHLIVTERGGRPPVGILSSLDIATAAAAS
jgi:CBS domain-containing protein